MWVLNLAKNNGGEPDSVATVENLSKKQLEQLSAPELAELVWQLLRLRHAAELNGAVHTGSFPVDGSGSSPVEAGDTKPEPHMVGQSPALCDVFDSIRRFALNDAPVLITGESGTGKELAARAIHERSSHSDGPFVAINCGGLPASLIASELFGYEKGAFTGASQRKIGLIESAAGGVVFLDEIGDLPLELQPHLLRFLQERAILRVGGRKPVPVSARIISATNRDLGDAVADGSFREDLYYRLDVLRLKMPPLRERSDDIALLATYFLRMFNGEMGREIAGFDPAAVTAINAYSWPGNVRELISRVRRAVVMARSDVLTLADLDLPGWSNGGSHGAAAMSPAAATAGGPVRRPGQPLKEALSALEAEIVRAALAGHLSNVKETAKELGVSRVTLYRLIEKHGIRLDRRAEG